MTSPDDRPDPPDRDAAVVFCATCGHSEPVHSDNGNRRCVLSVCDCDGFIVGAAPDLSAQVFPG